MARQSIPHPILTTARLRMRQFRADDAVDMHQCFADPKAMRFWDQPVHSKRSETERAVRSFINCTPACYRFWAVADAETDRCLGLVNYHDGHMRRKRVTIGYLIEPSRHRQGLASEAVAAMLDFCFGPLALHRVQAFIDPGNNASIGLAEKLGFHREGLLRDNLRVSGVWRSDLLYALLAGEWRGAG